MAKSERFDLYSCFKNALERERYLKVVQSRVYKTALARFRMAMGVSRTNGHRHRFLVAENQRFCPFCVNMTEDESHMLFVCPVYTQLRGKFPLPVYRGVSMKIGTADCTMIPMTKHCLTCQGLSCLLLN